MPKRSPRKAKGRPRSLADVATRAKVFTILRAGGSRGDAALHAGISHDTISREAKRDQEFADGLLLAESEGKLALILAVKAGSKEDWRAAAWMLERKHREEWGKRSPDQVTPEQLAAVIGRVVASILGEVPAEFHDRVQGKINDILGGLAGFSGA